MQLCSMERVFVVWKDCEEIKPKPKKVGSQNGGGETSNGVVCWAQHVSMHEVWKRRSPAVVFWSAVVARCSELHEANEIAVHLLY